jgi:hypothetical protein
MTNSGDTNPWIQHIKTVKEDNPQLKYTEVIQLAKTTYIKKPNIIVPGRKPGRPKNEENTPDIYYCKYCNYLTPDRSNFRKHTDKAHCRETELLKCSKYKGYMRRLCVRRLIDGEIKLIIRDHEKYMKLADLHNKHATRLMDIEFGVDQNEHYQPRKRYNKTK